MNEFVKIALAGWIPLVLVFFTLMRPFQAVLVSFIGAWLFLPIGSFTPMGVIELTKMSATCYGVLAGVALFDSSRFFAFRPRLLDMPLVLWCLMPLITGSAVGLEWRLNASLFIEQVVTWAIPWFIGRLYLTDLGAFKETAVAIVISGLVYMPFCWYELVMSPQLHRIVYGEHQHDFSQTPRLGGWRPMVFMQHGLMLAAWMTSASLVGVWLWLSGSVRRISTVPLSWLLIPLLGTTVMCKSLGALLLLLTGLGALVVVRYLRWTSVLVLLALVPPCFIAARLAGKATGDSLVALATMIDPERGESLQFRLRNEDLLMGKAMARPGLGWGWGEARIYDEYGNDAAVTDGMWIIYLGSYGLVGLIAVYACLLLPPGLAAWRARKVRAPPQVLAPILSLCVIAILFAVDTIPNSMLNPIFTLLCGGLANGAAMLSLATRPPAGFQGPAPSSTVAPLPLSRMSWAGLR